MKRSVPAAIRFPGPGGSHDASARLSEAWMQPYPKQVFLILSLTLISPSCIASLNLETAVDRYVEAVTT